MQNNPSQNKLAADSLEWALKHLELEGDGDLFPRPFEIDVLKRNWTAICPVLQNIDITNHAWGALRTVLVPKEQFAFRRACQLEPIDALLFASIVYEIAPKIERRRPPSIQRRVFSYRFSPQPDGSMFAKGNPWTDFWTTSSQLATNPGVVAVLDLSDFYNQIYHHAIENQLIESGTPNSHRKAILNLLNTYTGRVSRGVPIGPHASHLLAELALIPLDEYLSLKGYRYCRFVDDIHIACASPADAQLAVYDIASFLDTSQKLLLNKQKTEVLTALEHQRRCAAMRIDNPINADEEKILQIIKAHAGPYTHIGIGTLTRDEVKALAASDVQGIIKSYLDSPQPDFVRLRWFLRRLAQVGVPTGVNYVVSNLSRLYPAIGEVANYLVSATGQYQEEWELTGDTILKALEEPLVATNDYLQLVLLSLFARIAELDHFGKLVQSFGQRQASARREILLAAAATPGTSSWLQTLKGSMAQMDSWQRRAFLLASRQLPKDERKFWLGSLMTGLTVLEKEIALESKNF